MTGDPGKASSSWDLVSGGGFGAKSYGRVRDAGGKCWRWDGNAGVRGDQSSRAMVASRRICTSFDTLARPAVVFDSLRRNSRLCGNCAARYLFGGGRAQVVDRGGSMFALGERMLIKVVTPSSRRSRRRSGSSLREARTAGRRTSSFFHHGMHRAFGDRIQ